jgi:Uma2 family endonuclease
LYGLCSAGIAEYWIVDPLAEPLQWRIVQQVAVLEWVEGLYEEKA